MDELIGTALGPYQIQAKIGQGGMAPIFKAYQPSLDRYVAIKVLLPSFAAKNSDFVKRFQREAKSIARLHHPNILPVYDFGIDRDYYYIVMRYVEGAQTLSWIIPHFPNNERILDLMSQVASALAYAHKHGVIHRDVKPSNILLDDGWVLLSDFGLAKVDEATTRLTDTGKGIGTPAYMSPEQAQGGSIDHRTDIYALGVILYEMLTDTIPHDASTPLGILLKRTTQPPASPRTINPAISESVEHVVLRSLAANPKDRYDSATDFSAALKKAVADEAYREPAVGSLDKRTADFGLLAQPERFDKKTVDFAPEPSPLLDSPKNSSKENLPYIWRNPIWPAVGGASIAAAVLVWGANAFGLVRPPASPTQTAPIVAVAPTSTDTPALTPTLRAEPEPTKSQGEASHWPADEVAQRGQAKAPYEQDEARAPTNTPAPTDTPVLFTPTPTYTPISPTVTPTPTPLPSTPTNAPVTATALLVVLPTATATPASTIPDGVLTLLKPVSLDEPSYGPTDFEWEWTGDVPPGFGFEVRVWREGELPAGVHNAVEDNKNGQIIRIDENRYRLSVDIRDAAGVRRRSGEYLWTVVVIQVNPNYIDLGQQAPPARLRFEAGGGGGNGGGSEGAGNGGIF